MNTNTTSSRPSFFHPCIAFFVPLSSLSPFVVVVIVVVTLSPSPFRNFLLSLSFSAPPFCLSLARPGPSCRNTASGFPRVVKEEEQGEIRPLLLKTDRESVLRGEDYWIDYSEVAETENRRRISTQDYVLCFSMVITVVPLTHRCKCVFFCRVVSRSKRHILERL